MDAEVALSLFGELEKRVDRLFEKIEALEKEKAFFENRVKELERELDEKNGAVERLSRERDLVRAKIDALLEKINSFMELNNDAGMEEG